MDLLTVELMLFLGVKWRKLEKEKGLGKVTSPAGPHVCTRAYTGGCRLRRRRGGGHEGIHRGARRDGGEG